MGGSTCSTGKATPVRCVVSYNLLTLFYDTACFRSLFDYMMESFHYYNHMDWPCGADYKKMVIMNVLVACLSSKRTLHPWNFVKTSEPEHSFRGFYYNFIDTCCYHVWTVLWLVHAEVGTSKKKLEIAELDLAIIPVIEMFVNLLKYSVNAKQSSAETSTCTIARNAFKVLIHSQQSLWLHARTFQPSKK